MVGVVVLVEVVGVGLAVPMSMLVVVIYGRIK